MDNHDKLSLPAAARELGLAYRPLYNAVLDSRIPAVQVRGRYLVDRAELPRIATLLGLTPSSTIAA